MQQLLDDGYTTVLSGGGPAEGNLTPKEHIEKGVIKGPRIIPSGAVRLNTVSRLLERLPGPRSQTWRTFLTNHLAAAASMDFFTVPTLTGLLLFVLVLLSHQRRRIVHVNMTDHPTASWSAQQLVDAFPDDTAPRWLHSDRDSIYGDVFRRLTGMGIAEVVSAPASPSNA